MTPRRSFLRLCAGCVLASSAWWQGGAQGATPMKLIVGNLPGGITDLMARLMAEQLALELTRPVIVENRPGAAGNIAAGFVARAAPDGNTLLLIYNSHPSISALYPNLPFDPVKDFRSIGMVAGTPYLLVANPALPGATLAEVLAKARATDRPLTFATPGAGTPQHLMAERLRLQTGIPITIAHYKGLAPGQADVVAGHVDFTIASLALGLPHVQAGRLKVLATTAAERLARLPSVPTVAESGINGFVTLGWMALVAPAATPTSLVQRYNAAVNRILSRPEVQARLDAMGAVPLAGEPEVLDKTIQDESRMWGRIIKDLGIKPE